MEHLEAYENKIQKFMLVFVKNIRETYIPCLRLVLSVSKVHLRTWDNCARSAILIYYI